MKKELFLYFRFYPDGSVVSLLSTGTPIDVAKVIRRNLELSGNGIYSISGDRLDVRVTAQHGSLFYSGKIHGDVLALRFMAVSASHYTNSLPYISRSKRLTNR